MVKSVTLPNGKVLNNVPDDWDEDTTKKVAIHNGLITDADYAAVDKEAAGFGEQMLGLMQAPGQILQSGEGAAGLQAMGQGMAAPFQGLKQSAINIAEDTGAAPPGSYVDYTNKVLAQRDAAYKRALKQNPNLKREQFESVIGATSLLTELAGGTLGAGASASITKQLLVDGLIGGLTGAMEVRGANEPASALYRDMTIGAVIDLGLNALPSAYHLGSNAYKRHLFKSYNDPGLIQDKENLLQIESYIRSIPGNENFKFSPGQLSGSPEVIRVENMAKAPAQLRRAVEETQAIERVFQSEVDNLTGGKVINEKATAIRGMRLLEQHDQALRKVGREAWEGVEQSISDAGQRQLGITTNLMDVFKDLVGEAGDVLSTGRAAGAINKDLLAVSTALFDANKPTRQGRLPGVTGDSLNKVLKLINKFEQGVVDWGIKDPMARKAAGARMRAALNKDIDQWYDRRGGGKTGIEDPHIERIMENRTAYHHVQEKRRQFSESGLAKILSNSEDTTPIPLWDKLSGLDPMTQRQVREFLTDNNPQLLADVQAGMLQNAIDRAFDSRSAAQFADFDIRAFASGFDKQVKSSRGTRRIANNLFSPEQRKMVFDGVQAIKAIQNRTVRSGHDIATAQRQQAQESELAMNIISRSPEFLTRMMTRALLPGIAERLLLSPDGVKALQNMAGAPYGSTAMMNAITVVGMHLGKDFASTPAPQEQ